jgi:hypothetical protein
MRFGLQKRCLWLRIAASALGDAWLIAFEPGSTNS